MVWSCGACERLRDAVRRIALATLVTLFLLPAGGVRADQRDPGLDPLFANLQTADAVQARAIEEQIWLIWFRHPDRVSEGLLDEGTVLMGQRRWNEALDRFDQLVARAPDFAEAWNKRATTYFLLGDLERSVLDIQRTLALEPRHFGALSGLGQIYLQLDEPKAALRAFEAALAIHPGMPGVQRQVVDLRARIGGSDI